MCWDGRVWKGKESLKNVFQYLLSWGLNSLSRYFPWQSRADPQNCSCLSRLYVLLINKKKPTVIESKWFCLIYTKLLGCCSFYFVHCWMFLTIASTLTIFVLYENILYEYLTSLCSVATCSCLTHSYIFYKAILENVGKVYVKIHEVAFQVLYDFVFMWKQTSTALLIDKNPQWTLCQLIELVCASFFIILQLLVFNNMTFKTLWKGCISYPQFWMQLDQQQLNHFNWGTFNCMLK